MTTAPRGAAVADVDEVAAPVAPPAEAQASSGGGFRARTFESLADRNFRWFYLSLLGQMAAMNMQMLARGYLTYELTNDFAALGVVALGSAVPMLLLSVYGGVIADRASKKLVLQVGQTASVLLALAVAMLLVFDVLTFEHLVIAAVVQGVIMALMMPSRQAILPEVVGMRRLMNAVSLQAAGMNLMRTSGPAVGGVLIAVIGAEALYFLMAATYGIAVLGLFKVKLTPVGDGAARRRPSSGGLSDIREGLGYIRRDRTIFVLLAASFVTSLLAMPYLLMLPGFVREVFDGGAVQLGLLIAVGGVGSVVGALVLASLPPVHRGTLLLLSALLIGIALLGFSATPSIWVGGAFMFFVGVGSAGRQALGNVLLQSYAEDEYRGRVMSIFMTQFSLMSLGAFVVGVIAEVAGAQFAIGGMSVLLIVVSIAFLAFVPRLRALQ